MIDTSFSLNMTLTKSLLNMLDDTNLELSHNVDYVLDGGALL